LLGRLGWAGWAGLGWAFAPGRLAGALPACVNGERQRIATPSPPSAGRVEIDR
jgi:hypothetical protein